MHNAADTPTAKDVLARSRLISSLDFKRQRTGSVSALVRSRGRVNAMSAACGAAIGPVGFGAAGTGHRPRLRQIVIGDAGRLRRDALLTCRSASSLNAFDLAMSGQPPGARRVRASGDLPVFTMVRGGRPAPLAARRSAAPGVQHDYGAALGRRRQISGAARMVSVLVGGSWASSSARWPVPLPRCRFGAVVHNRASARSSVGRQPEVLQPARGSSLLRPRSWGLAIAVLFGILIPGSTTGARRALVLSTGMWLDPLKRERWITVMAAACSRPAAGHRGVADIRAVMASFWPYGVVPLLPPWAGS